MTIDPKKSCLTVYYDGSCPLCRAEIAHYAKQDGAEAIAFVDASRDDAKLGADLPQKTALGRFHVRTADGTLHSGAAGFVTIWKALPGWRFLAWVADRRGVLLVLEGGYRAFLPVRPFLSRLVGRLTRRPG